MTPSQAPAADARGLLAIGAVGLVARTHLTGLAPLLPKIRVDVALTYVEAGMVTGVSVLAMALAALLVPRLVGQHGTHRAVLVGLITISLGAAVRAGASEVSMLLAGAVGIGIGLGIVTASVPAAIKIGWPERPGLATGVHASGIVIGSAAAALLVIPLASALHGWRGALVVLALATAAGGALWYITAPSRDVPTRARWAPPKLAPASTAAVLFGTQSAIFYGLTAWLPTAYVERGWDPIRAASLSTIVIIAGLPATLVFAVGADRFGTRAMQLAGAAVMTLLGLVGLAWFPGTAPLWAIAAGLGMGGLLAVSMVLPLDLARSPVAVAGITAVMYVAGYLVASLAPTVLGAVREVSGDFSTVLAMVAVPALVLFPLAVVVDRVTRHPSAE